MKLSIEHYIATNNPDASQKLLEKYKIPKAIDMTDLIAKVHYVVRKNKDFAITDLANIDTPYRQLILSTIKPVVVTETKEVMSNACGCSGIDGETSNACGCSGVDGESSNCSGCGGKCGNKSSGVDGKTEKPKSPETKTESKENLPVVSDKSSMKDYMPLFVFSGIVVVAILALK